MRIELKGKKRLKQSKMKSVLMFIGLTVASVGFTQQKMDGMMDAYYRISKNLADGNSKEVAKYANEFSTLLDRENFEGKKELKKMLTQMKEGASLQQQRSVFSKLSDQLWQLVLKKEKSESPVYRMYCPMKDAYWMSNTKTVENPYYGKSMLNCGSISNKH